MGCERATGTKAFLPFVPRENEIGHGCTVRRLSSTAQALLALYGISGRWWWFQCEFSIAISPAIRCACNASRRQDGSLEWPPSLPVRVKRGRCSTGGSHGKGKEQFDRGETVFFSLPILVNCSARTINVIVFNCLRRMSVTFKMVSRGDKSWRASWAWSPPVVESVARLATLETGPPVSTSRAALLARISGRYRL